MASSLATILARARTLATQQGGDPTMSPLIDDLTGFRAMLDHVIQDVWRKKANDVRNRHDISVKHTVGITASSGAIPTTIMREFLPQADFQDSLNNKCIAWLPYAVDYNSGTTFTQIGYVTIVGDNFNYRAPAPNQNFTGSLFITVPTTPAIPTAWTDELDVTDVATNDIILSLSYAMKAQYSFDGITDPSDGK